MAQQEAHALFAQLGVEEGGHLLIQRGQHLPGPLDDGHLQPLLPQVLRQLQADEAAPGQDGGLGAVAAHKVVDLQGVLHRAQGEQLLQPRAGQLRLGGEGAGGEEELVIGVLKDLACGQVAHCDGFPLRVDGLHLMAHLHLHPEPLPEALGGLEGQVLLVGDDAPDVVGQAAVGIGHVAGALIDHHLGLLVQAADAGGSGGAACDAADDDDFHLLYHLSLIEVDPANAGT